MVEKLNLSEADAETYIEFCETLWPARSPGEVVKHQMFGYASPVQNEMELECQFQRSGEKPRWDLPPERFIDASRDWVLLLQVDSDDGKAGPGWMWGDAGMVYFWIHRDDLTGITRGVDQPDVVVGKCPNWRDLQHLFFEPPRVTRPY